MNGSQCSVCVVVCPSLVETETGWLESAEGGPMLRVSLHSRTHLYIHTSAEQCHITHHIAMSTLHTLTHMSLTPSFPGSLNLFHIILTVTEILMTFVFADVCNESHLGVGGGVKSEIAP